MSKPSLYVRVLGSAAGGGYPQWNCNHPNSRRARAFDANAPQRTQSSIAISADGNNWFLCNASPDLRQQINDNDILQPKSDGPLRASPIQGVMLTNADVDHVAGLLNLRESQPLTLYAAARVMDVINVNSIFNVLNPKFVTRENLHIDQPCELKNTDGSSSGLRVVPFIVPGKVALWLEQEGAKDFGSEQGDTIGLEVRDGDDKTHMFYIPGCASIPDWLADRLRGAPLVLFDGTLWVDDEMIRDQVGVKTGQRMGHMSVSGETGTIAAFANLEVARKVFIHINTTNPILRSDSEERKQVEQAGWEVSQDGMQITV